MPDEVVEEAEDVTNMEGDPNVSEPPREEVPPEPPRRMRNNSSGRIVTYCGRAYASGNFTVV